MADTTILTQQFVRISQTPASVGERLLALVVDALLVIVYIWGCNTIYFRINPDSNYALVAYIALVWLPALFYPFLCEVFNHGQSVGKRLMNIRVVKTDGSTPSVGAYLLRWLLYSIDIILSGGLGLLSILLTKNSQRLGDLAAGTMVIKEQNYKHIHVTLDEFEYLTADYRPVYPQAADLSLEQIDIIRRTLQADKKKRQKIIGPLCDKIQHLLSITPREASPEAFLTTIVRDYQHYALEDSI
ncbi:MAG: RDD family protein [Bacteroides sp.]|nr:RDD family protein [Bacteroides sp.]